PEYRFYPKGTIYPTPLSDGTIDFRWPILFPLLTRVVYDRLGLVGIYAVPLASGWLVAMLAGYWTYLFRPRAAPLAILLAGLATPVAFYSVSFFEHTLTTLLLCTGLTILVLRPGRLSSLLAMAPLAAAAVAMRIETAAFGAALLCA